jgi:hypothetical protein
LAYGYDALGIYYVPKVDLTTYVHHSRGETAGSMRCYGTIQTMTAPSNAWSAANPTILPVDLSTPICVRILKACRLIPN